MKKREVFDSFKKARENFIACRDEVIKLRSAQKTTEAMELVNKQLKPLFRHYSEVAAAAVAFNKGNSEDAHSAIQASVLGAKAGVLIHLVLTAKARF